MDEISSLRFQIKSKEINKAKLRLKNTALHPNSLAIKPDNTLPIKPPNTVEATYTDILNCTLFLSILAKILIEEVSIAGTTKPSHNLINKNIS